MSLCNHSATGKECADANPIFPLYGALHSIGSSQV